MRRPPFRLSNHCFATPTFPLFSPLPNPIKAGSATGFWSSNPFPRTCSDSPSGGAPTAGTSVRRGGSPTRTAADTGVRGAAPRSRLPTLGSTDLRTRTPMAIRDTDVSDAFGHRSFRCFRAERRRLMPTTSDDSSRPGVADTAVSAAIGPSTNTEISVVFARRSPVVSRQPPRRYLGFDTVEQSEPVNRSRDYPDAWHRAFTPPTSRCSRY